MKKIKLIIPLLFLSILLLGQSGRENTNPVFQIGFVPSEHAFNDSVAVEIYAPQAAAIYYTLNGDEPDQNSTPYTGAFVLKNTTSVRAVAYWPGQNGKKLSRTYFIGEPPSKLPIISLSVPPSLLFDPEEGFFMLGGQAVDTLWSKPGANFWSRDEIAIHTEIFESDGQCVFRSPTGLRLFGGMSRLFPQKSLALVVDERYGENKIKHRLFGKKGPKSFKFITLRNSGSDFGKTHFRDALMTGLLHKWDIDKQAYRPAHVYINGLYWGIYNMREKVNSRFLADRHDVEKDSIDLIEHHLFLKQGSSRHYRRMLDYLNKHDLSEAAAYKHIQEQMEVNNFLNYQIAQIYFDNQDAGGNIKYWRPQTPNGRWRWILYDTDWGFGLHDPKAYENNSLAFHLEPNGPKWPNPPWSTFILRKLLENPDFERAFVNSFADHLNTTFHPYRVDKHIDRYYESLLMEIPRHLARWRLSREEWEDAIQVLHTFARKRPQYVQMHLMERFNTGGVREVEASATKGGRIVINRQVKVRQDTFKGVYFENYPIVVQVFPDFGYRFSHWEGDLSGDRREHVLTLDQNKTSVRAVFVRYDHPLAGKVIINEISANNRSSKDWVEILNYSDEKINLKNWVFADSKHEFTLPDISVAPNDYLILCENAEKFKQKFPMAYNVVGNTGFGINKSQEMLTLYAETGAMVDSVSYDVMPNDSTFTFSFLLPHMNNANFNNWRQLEGVGTPNAPNPYYVESRIRLIQGEWGQFGLLTSALLICLMLLVLRWRKLI